MLAHVLHLVRTGQVMAEGDPGLESTFALNGTEGSPAQA
jgi:hypothetical protein